MKVQLTDLSPVKKRMVVEVPAEEVERETDGVLRDWRKKARISGFRPGKTPLEVIRSRFAKEVEDDVRERVVSRSFVRAAEEQGLRPVGDPALEELTYRKGEPLSFQTTFEVLPRIVPQNYKGIAVRRVSDRLAEAEVDRALEELRQAHARHVLDEQHRAAPGDLVIADIEGTPDEGERFRRERAQIAVGANGNLPAFNERLTGVGAGAELAFSVDYPAEHPNRELAGRRVAFQLRVHEVKRRELPALDDAFARDLGEFDDLAALRERIGRDLSLRKSHEADRGVRQAILDKLLLEHAVVLPEVLVERETRHRLEELVRAMLVQGIDPEKSEIDWEELRRNQEGPARRSVHARLVLDAVAEAEQLTLEPREIEARIREDAQKTGESVEGLRARLRKHGALEALRVQLLREKTLDYLTSLANIQTEE